MRTATFARTKGARDRVPRRRNRLLKTAGAIAGAGALAGGAYLLSRKVGVKGPAKQPFVALHPGEETSVVIRKAPPLHSPLDPDIESLLNESPKKLMNRMLVNQRREALNKADPNLLRRVNERRGKENRYRKSTSGRLIKKTVTRLRESGSYFMSDVSIARF